MWDFLLDQLSDENSDLVVVAQRVLSAEFSPEVQARSVLGAIGAGERTFKAIGSTAGIQATPLSRALPTLRENKRVVALDVPLAINPPDEPRYRVADPYLRFWLRFVEPGLPDIPRGRADLTLRRVRESWGDYRGRAIEPIVREALERLALSDPVLGESRQGRWLLDPRQRPRGRPRRRRPFPPTPGLCASSGRSSGGNEAPSAELTSTPSPPSGHGCPALTALPWWPSPGQR